MSDDPLAALEQFRQRLGLLAYQLHLGAQDPECDHESATVRRGACVAALAAVEDLVRAIDRGDTSLREPILWLMSGLADVENGRTDPLFTPERKSKPPLPILAQMLRGHVAAVQEMLVKTGKTPDEAARRTFQLLGAAATRRIASQQARDGVSWTTVRRWREAMATPASSNSPFGAGYRQMEARIAAMPLESPDARAARLLDVVATNAKKLRLRNPT